MKEDFVEPFETFFLQKVKQEFERDELPMKSFEQSFLLTTVNSLTETGFQPREAKAMISRTCGALNRLYVRDVGNEPDIGFQAWRKNNIELYQRSRRILSCVVQKWYITLGREEELKVRRSGMLYTWYSADATMLWDSLINASRIQPRRPG
jgi:hypothetical protein